MRHAVHPTVEATKVLWSDLVHLDGSQSSWLGLCYDLTTWLHFMHTLAFVLTFSAMAISFYFLLKEPLHIAVWLCGFLAILFTIFYTLFTYITNEANMGPIEHLSFLSYCCTYLAFSLLLN